MKKQFYKKYWTLLTLLILITAFFDPYLSHSMVSALGDSPSIAVVGSGYKKGTTLTPSFLHADDFRFVISDPGLNQIQQYSGDFVAQNSYGSFGQNAGEFDNVQGIFIFQNKLYICDSGNSRIQVLDFKGAMISQFSTLRESSKYYNPTDIAVFHDSIFISYADSNIIDRFQLNGSYTESLPDTLLGTDLPASLNADETYLYIALGKSGKTLAINQDFKVQFTLELKKEESSPERFAKAVTSDKEDFYILDSSQQKIEVYSKKTGIWSKSILIPEAKDPFDLVFSNKFLIISSPGIGFIYRYTKEGKLVQTLDTRRNDANRFILPEKIMKHEGGFAVFDRGANSIQFYKDDTMWLNRIWLRDLMPGQTDPVIVASDESNIYLLPSRSTVIQSFTHQGEKKESIPLILPETVLLSNPTDLTVFDHQFYLLDSSLGQILMFDRKGNFVKAISSFGNEPGKLLSPLAIAVSSKWMVVSDSQKATLQIFDKQGIFVKEIGGKGSEMGLFMGSIRPAIMDSKIVISDSDIHRIQIYDIMTGIFSLYGKYASIKTSPNKWTEQDLLNIQPNLGSFCFPYAGVPLPGGILISDTGNSRLQVLPYSLFGDSKIRVLPDKIDFGTIANPSVQKVITLYADTPFLSQGVITTNHPLIKVDTVAFDHLPIQIAVSLENTSPSDVPVNSAIQITSDSGDSITIPITGSFSQTPDFTLNAPSYFVAPTDHAIRIPLHVDAVNGFDSQITFTVKGVPKNTYPTFEPNFIEPLKSGDLELLLTKSPNQYWEPGIYDILVEATSQKLKEVRTATIRLFLNYSPQEIKRKVLVELFTGIWCKNCTYTHKAINLFNASFGNVDANFIEYYVFSKEDHPKPRLSCDESDERMKWYQYDQGLPSVYFDGTDSYKGVPTESRETAIIQVYKDKIDNRKKEPSPTSIIATSKFNPINRSGKVNVRLRTLQDLSKFKNLALYVALIESNIDYSAVSGEKTHHLLLRDFIRPASNPLKEISIPLFKANGELILAPNQEFSIELPFTLQDFYKPQDLQFVVFIQDQWSKKVLQSTSISLKTSESSDFYLTWISNPVQIKPSGSTIHYKINLYNHSQNSRKFSLRINSSQSMNLSLPQEIIELPAYSSRNIELTGSIKADTEENSAFPFSIEVASLDKSYLVKSIQGKIVSKADAPHDFSLDLSSPTPPTILSGEKLSIPLQIKQSPLFPYPVALSLNGDMDLVESYTFTLNHEKPDFLSTLDIIFKQKALHNSANFTISALGNKIEHKLGIKIAVLKNPKFFPPELIIYSPEDNRATNQSVIKIQGKTDPYTKIQNGDQEITPEVDGLFSFSYTLREGANHIRIVATNSAGLTNEITLQMTLDQTPPSLVITEKIWETKETVFVISGKTDRDAKLYLEEELITKEEDGTFALSLTLTLLGFNEGAIKAIDPAGNTAIYTYRIKRYGVIVLQIGSNAMVVNGENRNLDFPPYIKQGRTMVPLRALSEVMDYQVLWIPASQEIQIERGDIIITLWINQIRITNTTKSTQKIIEKKIDAAPEIKSGRTYIPLRLISEELGAKVEWDSKTSTIQVLY